MTLRRLLFNCSGPRLATRRLLVVPRVVGDQSQIQNGAVLYDIVNVGVGRRLARFDLDRLVGAPRVQLELIISFAIASDWLHTVRIILR